MRYVVMVDDVKVVLLLSLFYKRNEKCLSDLHLVTDLYQSGLNLNVMCAFHFYANLFQI